MSEKAWDWCLAELRDKAIEYQDKGFVRVLDTGSCVCKSDTLLDSCVSRDLGESFAELCESASHGQLRYIVDPQLYPLVRGETRVLEDGGVVPLDYKNTDAMLIAEEDTTLSEELPQFDVDSQLMAEIQQAHAGERRKAHNQNIGREYIDESQYWWSATYQCLPCDVDFVGDGATRIASYINNLHPSRQKAYIAIDKIISSSVKMWNECLIKGVVGAKRVQNEGPYRFLHQQQRGRYPLRIITFGVEWHDQLPRWARSLCSDHAEELDDYLQAKDDLDIGVGGVESTLDQYNHYEGIPPFSKPTDETLRLAVGYLGQDLQGMDLLDVEQLVKEEANGRRHWTHPEPGTAFSYEDWKSGRPNVTKAVVKMVKRPRHYEEPYQEPSAEPTHESYNIDLEESFHGTGLQVMVKVSEISLLPGEDCTGQWELDGHLNEHIVGRACFVYNASNIKCHVLFCQETPMYAKAYRYAGRWQAMSEDDDPAEWRYDDLELEDNLQAIEKAFGWTEGDILASGEDTWNTRLPVQETGSVQLREGRLITFPNVFEYRLRAEPIDTKLPSSMQCIWLDLVDPHYRICSTKNVPPQQREWWAASIAKLLTRRGLPTELVEHVMSYYECPMSEKRAEEHKTNMEKELGWIQVARHNDMTSFHFPYPQEF